jgi:hypothetical protein
MGDFTLEHENHNKLKAGGVVNYIVHRHFVAGLCQTILGHLSDGT